MTYVNRTPNASQLGLGLEVGRVLLDPVEVVGGPDKAVGEATLAAGRGDEAGHAHVVVLPACVG